MAKLNLKETLDSRFEGIWVNNLRRGKNGNWYLDINWTYAGYRYGDRRYKTYSGVRRLYTNRQVQGFECHFSLDGYDVHLESITGIEPVGEMSGTVALGPEKEKEEIEKEMVLKMTEWIPVEKELPEDFEDVLVTCIGALTNEKYIEKAFLDTDTTTWVISGWSLPPYPKVIAWQPFPEPYKEEIK